MRSSLIRLPQQRICRPATRGSSTIDAEHGPNDDRAEGRRSRSSATPVPPPFATRKPQEGPAADAPDPQRHDDPLANVLSANGPGQDLLPSAGWGWRHSLAGLLMAFAPVLVLSILASGSTVSPETVSQVSTVSLVALLADSLIMYGWQIAAAWLFSLRVHGEKVSAWGFRRPTSAFFWTIPLALLAVYAITFFHDLLVHPERQDILTRFPRTPTGIALLFILAVVIAPLFEELFFRGFLFRGLANSWGWVLGAAASSAAFGVAHAQLTIFVPLFALGFALAWVYKRTGSLWTAIAFHALFNAISVVVWVLSG